MTGKPLMAIIAFFLIGISARSALALSVEQVLALKKAGVGDQTIELMIRQDAAARTKDGDVAGVREIKEPDGRAVVIYSTGARPPEPDAAEQKKVEKAWEMLQHLIIDGRK